MTRSAVHGLLVASLLAACGGGGGRPAPGCTAGTQVIEAPASGALAVLDGATFTGCTARLHAAALGADERLALVLVNAGGADNASVSAVASGTLALADAPQPPAVLALSVPGAIPARGHELMAPRQLDAFQAWLQETLATGPQAAPGAAAASLPAFGDHRTFCVVNLAGSGFTARAATLQHVGPTPPPGLPYALFYVTDDVWANVQASVLVPRPDLWSTFDSYLYGLDTGSGAGSKNPGGLKAILPSDTANYGGVSDVDGNGAVIFLMTDLSAGSSSSFASGFFYSNDMRAADTTGTCTGTGSNHADMLYLMDPYHYTLKGYPLDTVLDSELPGTMAHELQHDILFNTRCLASGVGARCDASQSDYSATGDAWMNEGLSMVAEDLAGFGLHGNVGRFRVGTYLSCVAPYAGATFTCAQTASVTAWPYPGDPYGNYEGAHSLLRWHADQLGRAGGPAAVTTFLKELVGSTQQATLAVAAGSGLPFGEGYARFAAAALFSGETFDPAPASAFASGTAWSPLHATVAYPAWDRLQPGVAGLTRSLRVDGWRAFQTGLGSGGDATVDLTWNAAPATRRLAVVRFKGLLGTPATSAPHP